MTDILLKGGFAITVDPEIGNRPNTDILIRDGKIQAIGAGLSADGAEVVDAQNHIVMPGLVDAHRHLWQGVMRGVCADWSIMDYLSNIRMNAADVFSPDDMYAAQFHGGLECLNAGVTSVADYCHNILTPDHAHEAIRGLAASGVRAVWSYGFNFPPSSSPFFRTLEDRVDFVKALAQQYFSSKDQLLTLSVAPEERPFWSSPAVGKAQFEVAKELDARVFWHANTSDVNLSDDSGPMMPRDIAALRDQSLLSENVTGIHMHFTEEDEWKMLADAGAAVCFTPDTELQMGLMWPSTAIARKHGVTQAYGADIISNNGGDMFTQLRLGLQTARAKAISDDGAMLSGVPFTCEEGLKWGTIEGAKAIGIDDKVGSLSVGKQADILMVRTDTLTMGGWDETNPSSIMLQAQSSDIENVMVAGKFVKKNGTLLPHVSDACRLHLEATMRVRSQIEKRGGFALEPEETMNRIAAIASTEHGEYVS